MPIDYSKGKIYKIVDFDTDECYVGSTCEPTLARRLAGHVGVFKCFQNGKGNYVTSFKILENDNYDIQLIENFPCESKDELHSREGHWIKRMDCVNKCIAGRIPGESSYESRKRNKEKIIERSKKYNLDNKEKIREKQSKKMDCECGGKHTVANKALHERTVKHHKYLES